MGAFDQGVVVLAPELAHIWHSVDDLGAVVRFEDRMVPGGWNLDSRVQGLDHDRRLHLVNAALLPEEPLVGNLRGRVRVHLPKF